MDNIWYDSEALNGRSVSGEYSSQGEVNLGPTNKRVIPCDSCSRKVVCGVELIECEAFRMWCNKGNYMDEMVGIKLKAI